VKKLEKLQCKTKLSTAALVLILTISIVLVALPIATAQWGATVQIDIPTFLYVTAEPNPVGRGQIVYIHAVFSKPTPTNQGTGGDLHENVKITMVTPDGTEQVLGVYTAGMTGAVATYFTPDQVGTYTFKATYPGQVLTGKNPTTGAEGQNLNVVGSRLLPSESAETTLTVQEDPVESLYQTPSLPNEYWTRPIYSLNWNWGELGANWFGMMAPAFMTTGGYDATGNFQPYGSAPNTAHIMWSESTHFGGQPGAPIPSDESTQYSSTSVIINYFEPIILNGILYYTQFASLSTNIVSWEAVDIRTGETLWSRSAGETGTEKLLMGQIARYHSVQEFGSMAYLWSAPLAGFMQAPNWLGLYDAFTGDFVANITNIDAIAGFLGGTIPFMMDVECEQYGTILGHYTSGGNLIMWNSTEMFQITTFGYPMIDPSGVYNFTKGISWSVPLPTDLNGVPISLSIAARTPEVILLRETPSPIMWQEATLGYQITAGYDTKTGELLWGPINQTIPVMQDISVIAARDGYYVLHNKDANEAYGYSLTNGQKLWGPVKLEGNAWSSIGRGGDIAYGKVYIWDIGGWVHAIDLETGDIVWNFTRGSAGYDTPYGIYPIFHYQMHTIADGKLFLSEGHLYTPPLHPAQRLAIDCETGELVWSILSFSSRSPAAVADGYMIQWNSYDNKIYSFGKGPTELTVTASPKVSTANGKVLIEGTIMDISSGAEQDGVVERFPDGLPAVADEDMSAWMEYVYMQQMKPSNITGVSVKLAYQLPDGSWKDIDQVISNEYGNFGYTWTPPEEGTYAIKAFFLGSESYYGSSATTYLGVGPAAEDVPSAEEIADTTASKLPAASAIADETINKLPSYLTIDLLILIVAAVGVVIGLIAYMALRKQK
jgi:hypothetical protein